MFDYEVRGCASHGDITRNRHRSYTMSKHPAARNFNTFAMFEKCKEQVLIIAVDMGRDGDARQGTKNLGQYE